MAIDIINRQRKFRLNTKRLERRLGEVMKAAGVEMAEVALLLVSDRSIKRVNKEWRGVNRPTDCISFPAIEEPKIVEEVGQDGRASPSESEAPTLHLGDIVISVERAMEQARPSDCKEKALEDEIERLFVHSLLHLLGHDHMNEDEAKKMRAAERKIRARLSRLRRKQA